MELKPKSKKRQKRKPRKSSNRNWLSKLPTCDDELMDALYESYIMARRKKTKTNDEFSFEVNWMENLQQLAEDIITRKYKPSRSKAFITRVPVIREIFAAPFRDRIIHHLLYAVVAPWWEKRFVPSSFSCRVGKGTDYGAETLQKIMRRATRNGMVKAIVIKGDFSGYFMSMKRDILYEKVMWGLERQFPEKGWLYDLCAYLWKEVIYDDPTVGVRLASKRRDWIDLPLNKSLFHQPAGQGIVIGNLTSQLLSNIMLNEFDWWMKCTLGFRFYGRYVDDFYIVVPEGDYGYAMAVMQEVVPSYVEKIGLRLHPDKRYVQDTTKGCPFLGKKVFMDYMLLGDRIKKNAGKRLREFVNKGVDYDGIVSYIGMTKYVKAKKFLHAEIEKVGGRFRY